MTEVWFLFSHSGHIWKTIVHSSLLLEPYQGAIHFVFDAIFMLCVFRLMIIEMHELLFEVGGKYRGGQPLTEALRNYIDVWNFIDWVSIVLGMVTMALWINTCIM